MKIIPIDFIQKQTKEEGHGGKVGQENNWLCGYALVIVMLVRNNIKGGVRDTRRHVSLDNIYIPWSSTTGYVMDHPTHVCLKVQCSLKEVQISNGARTHLGHTR